MTTTLDFLVITKVEPHGDIGEPGWSVWGEEHKCSLHHHHRYWHGATQEQLIYVMPTSYITSSVYVQLIELGEVENIRKKILGVVKDDWRVEITNPYYGGGTCWAMDLDKVIPGLLEATSATPAEGKITCDGGSPNFGTGCKLLKHFDDDNDGVISKSDMLLAGDARRRGEITEEEHVFVINAYYAVSIDDWCSGCYDTHAPPSPDEDDEDEDDEGIFGDIDKKWIIIGIIAAVILGMLS